MPRKPIERQNTSWRISIEAKRLLELMAERLGTSQSAVFEAAIREKARRERITLEGRTAVNGAESGPAATAPGALDLHLLAERVRSGDEMATEELRRLIADRRAAAVIAPAKRPDELDAEWQARALSLVEQLRAGVPAEWTQEELEQRISQVIADLRGRVPEKRVDAGHR